jgi:hypothetical protein
MMGLLADILQAIKIAVGSYLVLAVLAVVFLLGSFLWRMFTGKGIEE